MPIARDKKIFHLTEVGTNNHLYVSCANIKCELYLIDDLNNSLNIEPPRCDYCLRSTEPPEEGVCTFIELKGSNIKRAVKQIENTILQVKKTLTNFSLAKAVYISMSGRIPSLHSGLQILKQKFFNKWNCELKTVRIGTTVKICFRCGTKGKTNPP